MVFQLRRIQLLQQVRPVWPIQDPGHVQWSGGGGGHQDLHQARGGGVPADKPLPQTWASVSAPVYQHEVSILPPALPPGKGKVHYIDIGKA